MSTTTAARPRQTTMAGVMVMLAAVFVVLAAFDRVARLRSLETRESLERVIDDMPGGFSPSVESIIQLSHVVAIVAALCAVAAVALGWQVLQGSRQARTILSVLAVPIFVTGLVAGGFMSSIVAVATVMLWLSPSREWFAGKPIPEPVKPGQTRRDANVDALTGRAPDELPVPTPAQPTGWPVTPTTPAQRPNPVTVAMVLTIVVAGFVLVSSLVTLVVLLTQPDLMLDELRRTNPELQEQGASDSLLLGASYLSVGVMLAASGLAVVLAVLMAKRRAWAARLLLICSAACALLCIIAAIASPVALIPAAAAIVTVNCLRRPEVRAWLDAR